MNTLAQEAQDWLESEWPVTIIADRYLGTYSGGRWTAWALEPSALPSEVSDDDLSCRKWWEQHRKGAAKLVGVGDTPGDALQALRQHAQRLQTEGPQSLR